MLHVARAVARSARVGMLWLLLGLVLCQPPAGPRGQSPGSASVAAPTTRLYLPLVSDRLRVYGNGMLRGVFEGGGIGDSGRTRLGQFDRDSGLRHYLIKFYWNLEDESISNGTPSIARFAQEVWDSGRMPVLDIRTAAFEDNDEGLSALAAERLRGMAQWLGDTYEGEIWVSLFSEMNLAESPYCPAEWDANTCMQVFKRAFRYAGSQLHQAAPNRVFVGLVYNMRFLQGSDQGPGTRYADWDVEPPSYDWAGYNVFVHACHDGQVETMDPWFLKGAMAEPGNDWHERFCTNSLKPCIIAETAASDSCAEGYQDWWIERFAVGAEPGQPFINQHLPGVRGYIWFNQNNEPRGGWEEDWQVQDYGHYRAVFGDPSYRGWP